MARRLIDEALEAARLPELAGRGIGGVHCELGREQHGVDAGIRYLLRHQLPVADVALQRRAIAVEEHHDHARLPGIERLGDMHQHAAVVVGLVLPIDPAAIAAVALAVALGDVEERFFGARIGAEIGEGRGLHADQRGQFFALAAGQRQRLRQRRDPHGLGTRGARLRRQRNLALDLRQAFIGGRETVGKSRLGETVVKRID